MTAQDRFDRDLAVWLDSESTLSAPAGLHAEAMNRASAARQRPAWLAGLRAGQPRFGAIGIDVGDRRAVVLLVAMALLTVGLLVAIAAGALRSDLVRPLGRNGILAYSFMNPSGTEMEGSGFVAPDGSAHRPIETGGCPTFSADGGHVSYFADEDGEGLLVGTADGTRLQSLPGVATAGSTLSPDATRVASLQPTAGGEVELWVTDVNGGRGQVIVRAAPGETIHRPAWSPDGTRLAFALLVMGDDGVPYRKAIDVVDADGSNRTRVTSRIGPDVGYFAWSPDGRSIAYVGLPDGATLLINPTTAWPWDVFVIGPDGTGEARVAGAVYPEALEWSPDGRYLAMQTLVGETWHLATIPMDGREAAGAMNVGPEWAGAFVWSPDGARLAYVATLRRRDLSQPGVSAIRTVDPVFAEQPATVLEMDQTMGCLSWQRLAR